MTPTYQRLPWYYISPTCSPVVPSTVLVLTVPSVDPTLLYRSDSFFLSSLRSLLSSRPSTRKEPNPTGPRRVNGEKKRYEALPRDALGSTSSSSRHWSPNAYMDPAHSSVPRNTLLHSRQKSTNENDFWCWRIEGRFPGTSLGGIISCLSTMEETLSALERILTTPLPFVYSVHICHTVCIYLFFLPFQLLCDFHYYTIPGVSIAAFIYLGLLAAGEEIEQPFGYDENDLDLDMFVREIIHVDVVNLKKSLCLPEGEVRRTVKMRRSMSLRVSEFTVVEGDGNGCRESEEEY
ncbi:UPF0187-domain-containing protein [Dendrothele bispora CBS 962.96]|uniref:UPF0187-domain-containing protein n=1 Tax=Dendrothele bispora (strain CBS 962.96) TaxID=1314807 RepID=A0A4S8LZL6_DENBC|nr:UPF0187-domain-containing protein [Dendrothele bispora CBS 962.96]